MKISIHNECPPYSSYRAARVQSLFNVTADQASSFRLEAELDLASEWGIGLVVGPSGSGKTSIGRELWGDDVPIFDSSGDGWPADAPIIDAISPDGDFDAVTGALSSVGLGSVPSWLRPFRILSMGEQFRAGLARIICDGPQRVIVDEFTSVVDRQIAQVGAAAFAKAWRRTGGQAVLLSCHYDIIDWLQPDWVYDTGTGEFARRSVQRPPAIEVDIWETDWRYWHLFEPHHYLKAPMIAARCYVGFVNGEPIVHLGMGTRPGLREARGCRLVVMPEWQGAGVGLQFLHTVAEAWLAGNNPYKIRMPTLFHTSHPGLCTALRRYEERDGRWVQISAELYGADKVKSAKSIGAEYGGYGGHMRAVQGFRYVGKEAP